MARPRHGPPRQEYTRHWPPARKSRTKSTGRVRSAHAMCLHSSSSEWSLMGLVWTFVANECI